MMRVANLTVNLRFRKMIAQLVNSKIMIASTSKSRKKGSYSFVLYVFSLQKTVTKNNATQLKTISHPFKI